MGRIKLPKWIDVAIYLRREGTSIAAIAQECEATVSQITYHLKSELSREEYEGLCLSASTEITTDRSNEIIRRLELGESPSKIADVVGVNTAYVYNFKHHKLNSFVRKVDEEVSRRIYNQQFWERRGVGEIPDGFSVARAHI